MMVYLERVETEWPLRIQLPSGTRVPFYCTASGKMYLSSLPEPHLDRYLANADMRARTSRSISEPDRLRSAIQEIRENGYATDNEEFMDGMIAIAVPIEDSHGRLFATLSFHAPVQRFDAAKALSYLPQLRNAANELSQLSFSED
nr:IclR family transcriptional regulator C-terminal domain-containing protein [Pararhizobium haloflavum]